jgi:hypothetical protein
MIHDRARQSVMVDQDERVAKSRRCGYVGASFFKRLSYVHSDKRFILDNDDRGLMLIGSLGLGSGPQQVAS